MCDFLRQKERHTVLTSTKNNPLCFVHLGKRFFRKCERIENQVLAWSGIKAVFSVSDLKNLKSASNSTFCITTN